MCCELRDFKAALKYAKKGHENYPEEKSFAVLIQKIERTAAKHKKREKKMFVSMMASQPDDDVKDDESGSTVSMRDKWWFKIVRQIGIASLGVAIAWLFSILIKKYY